jgi:hypothetical protein
MWQSGHAQTQPDINLDSVTIHLLPEYIHPTVLVIYEIYLDETIPLPQKLTVEVPADVEVLSVINITTDDRPIELEYQKSPIGMWKNLQFNAATHHIRIEYQDPNLVRQGDQRMYEFRWLSLYPVSVFSVSVRQPLGASEIQSLPALNKLEDPLNDLTEYSAVFGAFPAGELFTLMFSYTKNPSDLAFPALPVEPASPINGNAPGRTPSPTSVILWLLIASVAVIIVVGLYFWRFLINLSDERERVVQGVGIMNPEKQVFFCHECGMRSRAGGRYCNNCGSELRKISQFD